MNYLQLFFMFQGTKKLRTNNASLSPLSPTTLFSPHLTANYYQNLSDNVTYKSTTLTEASKMQQLPDLVKESSILKSKTAPNICDKSSIKDRERIEDRIFLHRTKTAMNNVENLENLENLQNIEHVLSSNMEENNDFRPRSPLHETSIVVPQDWKKSEDKDISSEDSEIDSDSLSSDFNEMTENDNFTPINVLPPRLQIHSTDGDLVLDEGVEQYKYYISDDAQAFEPDSIEVSFLQDQKLLNRCALDIDSSIGDMHIVETMNNNMEHLNLRDKSNCSSPISETSIISNKQDDSEENDITTAFTETEFSEWARDGEALVSDDLYDVELDSNFVTVQKKDVSFFTKRSSMPIYIAKKDETEFDFSKNDRKINQKFSENNTSILLNNDEDINYMDTDNELLLDDSLQDVSNITMLRNQGYVEFVNIKANISIPVKTQCNLPLTNAPLVKLDLENDLYDENEREGFKDANVIEIDPITMEDVVGKLNESIKKLPKIKSDIQMKTDEQCKKTSNKSIEQEQLAQTFNKELLQSMEEDSLLTVEPADDTTTSDAITVVASPVSHQMAITSTEMIQKQEGINKANCSNPDYLEYINKLQFRIAEFNNTKDSIDVRKSKRKILKNITQTHNTKMITENTICQEITNDNNTNSSVTSRKLEEITKERSKQKDLIQDLLMDKLEAHKQRSAEKKARRATRLLSFSKIRSLEKPTSSSVPSIGTKFVPTSISPINSSICTIFNETKELSDVVISSCSHEQYDPLQIEEMTKNIDKSIQDEKSITVNLQNIFESFAPAKSKNEEQEKIAIKHRQDTKNWNKIKSNENLSLNLENKRIKELEMNMIRSQFSMENMKENIMSMSEKIKPYSFSVMDNLELKLQISKSTDNIKNFAKIINFEKLPTTTKSMDELYTADMSILDNCPTAKKNKRKPKDLERRKSIIQAVSDFFFKKETNSSLHEKEKTSMFRLTSKSKGKVSIIIIINTLSVY